MCYIVVINGFDGLVMVQKKLKSTTMHDAIIEVNWLRRQNRHFANRLDSAPFYYVKSEDINVIVIPLTAANTNAESKQIELGQKLKFTNRCLQKNLTLRQAEVLYLKSFGHPMKIIADQLCIDYETIKTHLKDAYETLEVHSAIEAFRALGYFS